MAFIGNTVQNQGFTPAVDYFNGNGVTVTFTLSRPVASVAQMIVAIDNVIQNPSSSFTVAGNAITFTSAPLSGTNNIWVEYTSLITTYNGLSQSPSVIGDITASGGYLATGSFGNSFIDGTIVDYVTGNGRVTVGPGDGLTIYNGGTSARTAMAAWDTSGNLTNTGNATVGVGTASTNVQFSINGVANKAQRITFQESGTQRWLLGQGAASETSAFELYNATGTVVISVNRSTNNITLSNGLLNASGRQMLNQTGGVLQVVNATANTQYSTTSGTYVSTGFSATITPSSTSSKILVFYGCGGIESNSNVATTKGNLQIWRGGSSVFTVSNSVLFATQGGAGPACSFLDSPATTSAVTYTLYFSSNIGTFYVGTNTSSNSFTLMEISQ